MEALETTLEQVGVAMAPAAHDWWVIASAACWLHGTDAGPVRDVDVLMDERDTAAVLGALGLQARPGKSDAQFRSRCFVTWREPPMAVEFFAGFELCEAGQWSEVGLATREWRRVGPVLVPVPERTELASLLRRFGRPKDLVRAELLSPSGPSPSRSGSA